MRKSSIVLVLACLVLTGCGLRGGLVRPDPIFRDVAPIEDVMDDEIAAEEPLVLEEPTGPRVNEFGGEIPEAAPVEPVEESPITGEASSG